MKTLFGSAVLAAAAFALQAEVVTGISTLKDVNHPDRLEATGEKQFKVKKTAWFTSSKKFPIAPGKSYRIKGEFRIAPGEQVKGRYSIGFYSVGKDGRIIDISNVCARPDTETELAAPVNPGDKVFKIKDGSKWVAKNSYIAFDVDPSGKMRDLPCHTLSGSRIVRVGQKDGFWEVEVKNPVKTAYPAGAAVREHLGGWSYLCCPTATPKAEWTALEWTVKPGASKKNTNRMWLFGAEKFITVMVLPAGMEFRNVVVESID